MVLPSLSGLAPCLVSDLDGGQPEGPWARADSPPSLSEALGHTGHQRIWVKDHGMSLCPYVSPGL